MFGETQALHGLQGGGFCGVRTDPFEVKSRIGYNLIERQPGHLLSSGSEPALILGGMLGIARIFTTCTGTVLVSGTLGRGAGIP